MRYCSGKKGICCADVHNKIFRQLHHMLSFASIIDVFIFIIISRIKSSAEYKPSELRGLKGSLQLKTFSLNP